MNKKKILGIILLLLVIAAAIFVRGSLPQTTVQPEVPAQNPSQGEMLPEEELPPEEPALLENGAYSTKEDVALYLHLYGKLPTNYLTKAEAAELGWVANKGNLWEVTDHGCIGGDRFGNREGLLPTAEGRRWFECDVNYTGGYRGEERLLYSNDGLIFYTGDHYASVTLLHEGEVKE